MGIDCPNCGSTGWRRCRTGPTGRKISYIYLLADCCTLCGHIKPVSPGQLIPAEKRWVARWNTRITKEIETNGSTLLRRRTK